MRGHVALDHARDLLAPGLHVIVWLFPIQTVLEMLALFHTYVNEASLKNLSKVIQGLLGSIMYLGRDADGGICKVYDHSGALGALD